MLHEKACATFTPGRCLREALAQTSMLLLQPCNSCFEGMACLAPPGCCGCLRHGPAHNDSVVLVDLPKARAATFLLGHLQVDVRGKRPVHTSLHGVTGAIWSWSADISGPQSPKGLQLRPHSHSCLHLRPESPPGSPTPPAASAAAAKGGAALAAYRTPAGAVPPFALPLALDKGGGFAAGLQAAAMASSAIRFATASLEGGPQTVSPRAAHCERPRTLTEQRSPGGWLPCPRPSRSLPPQEKDLNGWRPPSDHAVGPSLDCIQVKNRRGLEGFAARLTALPLRASECACYSATQCVCVCVAASWLVCLQSWLKVCLPCVLLPRACCMPKWLHLLRASLAVEPNMSRFVRSDGEEKSPCDSTKNEFGEMVKCY